MQNKRQVKCGIISHSFFDLGQTFLEILNMCVDAAFLKAARKLYCFINHII